MLKTERTKIVATLGPASSNREVLGGMVHGYLTMGGRIDTANRTVSIVAATLAQAPGVGRV
jgi:pyruvate kinase